MGLRARPPAADNISRPLRDGSKKPPATTTKKGFRWAGHCCTVNIDSSSVVPVVMARVATTTGTVSTAATRLTKYNKPSAMSSPISAEMASMVYRRTLMKDTVEY